MHKFRLYFDDTVLGFRCSELADRSICRMTHMGQLRRSPVQQYLLNIRRTLEVTPTADFGSSVPILLKKSKNWAVNFFTETQISLGSVLQPSWELFTASYKEMLDFWLSTCAQTFKPVSVGWCKVAPSTYAFRKKSDPKTRRFRSAVRSPPLLRRRVP